MPSRWISILLVLAAGLLCGPTVVADDSPDRLLLGRGYPLEVSLSFHFALLHWMDSLGGLDGPGMTAGKTIEAHRREYAETLGAPDDRSLEVLRDYVQTRWEIFRRMGSDRRHALSTAFLESQDLDHALASAEEILDPEEFVRLRDAVEQLAPLYRRIWNDGAIPQGFVDRVRRDRKRKALAGFLAQMAGFYRISPNQRPYPRIVLTPVPRGYGTHAQAIDRHLLIEIRDGERLIDELSPIVHENAHFLFYRIDRDRRQRLQLHASRIEPDGIRAWQLLHEALPTALGQGVAAQRFNDADWAMRHRWYHRQAVDRYAKRIYPLVRDTLAAGGTFDESFLDAAVALYTGDEPQVTPGSP